MPELSGGYEGEVMKKGDIIWSPKSEGCPACGEERASESGNAYLCGFSGTYITSDQIEVYSPCDSNSHLEHAPLVFFDANGETV
jgi:hypothetical protein